MDSHGIFISYRRDDTGDVAGRIYDRLTAEFGKGRVFKDVDNIPAGSDFGIHIRTTLFRCRVLIALIGPRWVQERLRDRNDWVRREIEFALANSVQVIPVLINDTAPPSANALPESVQPLSLLNAARVRRDPDFHKDMDDLVVALRRGALANAEYVPPLPRSPGNNVPSNVSRERTEELEFKRKNIWLTLERLQRTRKSISVDALRRVRADTAALEREIAEDASLNPRDRQYLLSQVETLYSAIDLERTIGRFDRMRDAEDIQGNTHELPARRHSPILWVAGIGVLVIVTLMLTQCS